MSYVRNQFNSKRKRAFRQALGQIYRMAASFCCFLVRRFVVLPFLRFVVRCVVLVPFVSMRRPVVLSFVVSGFGRFVAGDRAVIDGPGRTVPRHWTGPC